MIEEKTCPKCLTLKKADQFYKSASRPDGLSSYCRECQVRESKSRYSPHPRWRAPEGQKWCSGCQDTLPIEAFGKNRSQHDGLQGKCKKCCVKAVTASRHKDPTSHRASSKRWREKNADRHADNNAKRNYGLEHGSYTKMLEDQGGKCAICKTDKPGRHTTRFHIDHCHDSGKVRGLLCANCNIGLGNLQHDPSILKAAIQYLSDNGLQSNTETS